MRSFSKKLAFVLAAAMVVTAFAPAAKAEAAKEMAINKQGKILYVTDGKGINDAAQVGGGKGNVSSYDFAVSNKPANWKSDYTFTWSSSDEDVITVKNGGLTTAVGAGKADVVCVVTEKATGKTTKLTNTVTVKANAADVVITNADDYANTAIEVGTVVDLNRAMYDANGTKAPKRGVVVTDYTRWMAEPSTGVKIDSSKGTFEFTEEAVAGEYKLWAETYQSKKYQAATAKSDVVKVELVKDMTFDVKQTTTTKFTVFFNSPAKSLNVADVTVSRMLGNYPYVQTVKSAKLAEDKMSAEIEIFNTLNDKVNYTIKINGYEEYTMTASNGKPVRMDVVALNANGGVKNPPMVIFTNEATDLACIFYDANDVVVSSNEKVRFTLDKAASTKDCYLNGSKLTIKKDTASAVVVAAFPGWIENGKRVGDFTQTQAFFAENKAEVFPNAVSFYSVDGNKTWGDSVHSFQMKNKPGLYVRVNQTDGQYGNEMYGYGNMDKLFKGDLTKKNTITFTALNPDVCVISKDGVLTGFKPGVAAFYVNYKRYNADEKKYEELPFATIEVEVLANSELGDVNGTASSLKVGTHDDYDRAWFYMLGYDQYGARYNLQTVSASSANFKVECLSEGYGDQEKLASILRKATGMADITWDGQGKNGIQIVIDANDLKDQLVADKAMDAATNGEFVDLEFRATYTHDGWNKKVVEFTVCIQEPSGDDADNIVEVVASDVSKDVIRRNEWNQKDQKTVNYKVNIMNNDVQVGVVDVAKYDAKNVSEGAYQIKVLKNGEDITGKANVSVSGHVVTLTPTGLNNLSARAQKAVSGGAIKYVTYDGVGEGVYTLELYKWSQDDNKDWIDSLESTSDISITVSDLGTYTLDTENQRLNKVSVKDAVGDEYDEADAKKILTCFMFTNRTGGNVVNFWSGALEGNQKHTKFFVDYSAPADSKYVYVKEVVFYEPVDGAWAAYVVPVDISLERQ